ncbi:YrzI family small protein [Sporolactobacillus shoreicorticis]|uniref:YrzI family small protein n=1 Tax=Sporolactobacillus shoreicorticis TaxID=1923877 RepID=A0ABW5S536_9BACL|nr:YrzI family small protein [Sporolactobacillus shoreicorticis]MCO7124350.1 YrzI family small protein [Sporolactobacillus shoreicorticis]
MTFSLFAFTFTIRRRKQRTPQERYQDRVRIEKLRNQMLDRRFEHDLWIR